MCILKSQGEIDYSGDEIEMVRACHSNASAMRGQAFHARSALSATSGHPTGKLLNEQVQSLAYAKPRG